MKLKWTRVTDSDGTAVKYTAATGRPERSYKIFPSSLALRGTGDRWYTVGLWTGDTLLDKIGSVRDTAWGRDRRGEYKLSDAKAAAQAHYDAAQVGV